MDILRSLEFWEGWYNHNIYGLYKFLWRNSMDNLRLSLMEINDIQESASVLSVAMLDNPLHVAIFQGKGEKERIEIEKMFCEILI